MYWIKNSDGALINLAKAASIEVSKGELLAYMIVGGKPHEEFIGNILFRGSDAECGKFRDHLFAKLQEQQRGYHEID